MEQKPKAQENDYLPKRGNPLQETICYKIGGTVFEIETSCGGTEPLYDKNGSAHSLGSHHRC